MKKSELKKIVKTMSRDITDIKNKLNSFLLEEFNHKEVATELKLSESTIYKIDPMKLPFFKRGKFRIYRKDDVLEYKRNLEMSAVSSNQ